MNKMAYHYKNILGDFIIDPGFQHYKKGKTTMELPSEMIRKTLPLFKEKSNFAAFHEKNIELTKKSLRHSVSDDQLITQAISNINELDKVSNTLTKRLREWFSWYYPELSETVTDNKKFAELAVDAKRPSDSFGASLEHHHVEEIVLLAKEINKLYSLREKHEEYLETVLKKYCPNLQELAGTTIAAKLLELGKSLKHLAMLPASTIQLLGAEKALFRHILTGSRSPKYGVLFQHPFIQNAQRNERGKAARMLADKLSLCARLDYFKGEFLAKEYRKEMEAKLCLK